MCAYNVSEIVLSILHELAFLNLITILFKRYYFLCFTARKTDAKKS